jgi:predicted nucleotidyltransferase
MLTNADALNSVVQFLNQHDVPYMLIGGVANALWGQVRATRDADFKVSIGNRSIAEFRQLVSKQFSERQTTVPPHLQPPHIIHVWATAGVAVDFFVSIFDYELQAIEHAVGAVIEGVPIRICTAEDLIVHKAIANREQDWIDIEGVLIRQHAKLDQAYILNWLRQFAAALETPDIVTRYEQLRAKRRTAL